MNKLRKIVIIILAVIIGIGIVITIMFKVMEKKTNDAISAQVNVDIDMTKVQDGTYVGKSDGGMVQVEVEVTVLNHEITSIHLLKHENGKGKPAEAIIDQMMEQNTDNVDSISGATTSSKTIRNAVNCALKKGL